MAYQAGMTVPAQTVYEEILKYYQSLLNEKSDDPAVKREASRVWFRSGVLRHFLGQSEVADADYSNGVKLLEELVTLDPDNPELLGERANAYLWHGHILRKRFGFDHATAMASYENAMALLERLIAQYPNRLDFQQAYANGHELGDIEGAARMRSPPKPHFTKPRKFSAG